MWMGHQKRKKWVAWLKITFEKEKEQIFEKIKEAILYIQV
jgi:hypothetical protein